MNDGTTRGTDRRRWARYTVFALMSLFLLLGSALVLGETFADPGGLGGGGGRRRLGWSRPPR